MDTLLFCDLAIGQRDPEAAPTASNESGSRYPSNGWKFRSTPSTAYYRHSRNVFPNGFPKNCSQDMEKWDTRLQTHRLSGALVDTEITSFASNRKAQKSAPPRDAKIRCTLGAYDGPKPRSASITLMQSFGLPISWPGWDHLMKSDRRLPLMAAAHALQPLSIL